MRGPREISGFADNVGNVESGRLLAGGDRVVITNSY